MFEVYEEQVKLLLKVLPIVAKEPCFALHGGTAINLFIKDMPRLSVDVDLTYLAIEDRNTSIRYINEALLRIKNKIESTFKQVSVIHDSKIGKLFVTENNLKIKLEVNLINRGTFEPTIVLPLCKKAQETYGAYLEMPIVPLSQLYGGKLCAALDRQHPRDVFDVKLLLENEGYTEEIKIGFIFCLLSADRPIHELLYPTLLDQSLTLESKFQGMTNNTFNYNDFEVTRSKLLKFIDRDLTEQDKQFLISFESGNPNWTHYDFSKFPGIQWKLINIQKLKATNPEKHTKLLEVLMKKLKSIE